MAVAVGRVSPSYTGGSNCSAADGSPDSIQKNKDLDGCCHKDLNTARQRCCRPRARPCEVDICRQRVVI